MRLTQSEGSTSLHASLPENGKSLKNWTNDQVPGKTVSVNFSCALISLLDFLALEYGTNRFSQNVGKELLHTICCVVY